jgi:hypothetical protein
MPRHWRCLIYSGNNTVFANSHARQRNQFHDNCNGYQWVQWHGDIYRERIADGRGRQFQPDFSHRFGKLNLKYHNLHFDARRHLHADRCRCKREFVAYEHRQPCG